MYNLSPYGSYEANQIFDDFHTISLRYLTGFDADYYGVCAFNDYTLTHTKYSWAVDYYRVCLNRQNLQYPIESFFEYLNNWFSNIELCVYPVLFFELSDTDYRYYPLCQQMLTWAQYDLDAIEKSVLYPGTNIIRYHPKRIDGYQVSKYDFGLNDLTLLMDCVVLGSVNDVFYRLNSYMTANNIWFTCTPQAFNEFDYYMTYNNKFWTNDKQGASYITERPATPTELTGDNEDFMNNFMNMLNKAVTH